MQKTAEINWDLTELHSTLSIDETQPILDQIKQDVLAFSATYKGTIATLDSSGVFDALVAYDDLRARMYKLSQFAHLNYAVDLKDDQILGFVAKLDEFTSLMGNELLFFFLEIGQVNQPKLDEWLADEKNTPYAYTLTQAVKKNKFRLTETEEQLINIKDLNGCDALRKLYAEHTAQYEFKMMVDGEEKVMNGSECRALRYHSDPEVRRKAMALFFTTYSGDQHIMVQLFNAIIKDYNMERQQRGYERPMDIMNTHNDLPNDLVQLLHDVTTDSNTIVQEYYQLKKSLLGLDEITLADIYAPVATDQTKVEWADAKALVLDSFQQFDSEFYEFAKDMFDSNRLDVFPSKVKRGGAFCSSSSPDVRPYVMLNYLGKQRDVSTLAHELGHAIHAYYSAGQPLINYHAILPVCETASVFCEMLVIDALKEKGDDKRAKNQLINQSVGRYFCNVTSPEYVFSI